MSKSLQQARALKAPPRLPTEPLYTLLSLGLTAQCARSISHSLLQALEACLCPMVMLVGEAVRRLRDNEAFRQRVLIMFLVDCCKLNLLINPYLSLAWSLFGFWMFIA